MGFPMYPETYDEHRQQVQQEQLTEEIRNNRRNRRAKLKGLRVIGSGVYAYPCYLCGTEGVYEGDLADLIPHLHTCGHHRNS